MTKEEYLNMYKEDKLAEICAQLDSENDDLIAQIAELGDCVGELNKKCEELDIWDDTEKVFTKLKSIPAKDFIRLYYLMQSMMYNHERYEKHICDKSEQYQRHNYNTRLMKLRFFWRI